MGVFLGITDILMGLCELWSGASLNRLFGWRTKEHHTGGYAFTVCGCLSILICALSGFWNFRLDGLTYLAERGGLILYGVFREIHRLRSCTMEVDGVFSHFSSALGIMPVFTYRVGKKQYQKTSQMCDMEKYRSQLKAGETYAIFVNPRDPSVFTLTRKAERSSCLMIPVGVLLIIPWLIYCRGLLTK